MEPMRPFGPLLYASSIWRFLHAVMTHTLRTPMVCEEDGQQGGQTHFAVGRFSLSVSKGRTLHGTVRPQLALFLKNSRACLFLCIVVDEKTGPVVTHFAEPFWEAEVSRGAASLAALLL